MQLFKNRILKIIIAIFIHIQWNEHVITLSEKIQRVYENSNLSLSLSRVSNAFDFHTTYEIFQMSSSIDRPYATNQKLQPIYQFFITLPFDCLRIFHSNSNFIVKNRIPPLQHRKIKHTFLRSPTNSAFILRIDQKSVSFDVRKWNTPSTFSL